MFSRRQEGRGSPLALPLLLLLVFLGLLLLGCNGQNGDGTCANQRPRDATFDCQHGADCSNGTCYCTPGFTHHQCGFDWTNCMCLECIHGYMVNSDKNNDIPHWCECDERWAGRNCDLCDSDELCQEMFPNSLEAYCDRTPVVSVQKTYDCNVTDAFFQSLFPGAEISFQIYREGMNVSQGTMNLQVWINGSNNYMQEMFYCLMEECREEGSSAELTYICEKTVCGLTGTLYAAGIARRLIENAEGTTYARCKHPQDGIMDCVFYQESFEVYIAEISALCWTGECFHTPFVITQPFNPTSVIVVSAIAFGVILVVAVSMYLYRKRQQRYFHFAKTKGQASFIDLDETVSFGNDILYFDDICYSLENKLILNHVSGYALPGEVLAIIGASGAGKTTLLDILAQRLKKGKVTGNITLNGEPLGDSFLRISSYVDQEPAAIGTQTVRELLMTAAHLRLPEVFTTEQKKARIMSLVQDLGIDHILDRRYGEHGKRGISGGEKRRVQIACQLVTGPSVIFLDEPTSGLDSYNALLVARFLKTYAQRKNRAVIMSIHQPRSDIFQTFNKLMVLSGGRTIYFGPTSEAKAYFETVCQPCPPDFNPADYILDMSMRDENAPVELNHAFQRTHYAQNIQKMLEDQHNEEPGVYSTDVQSYGAIDPPAHGYTKMKTQLPVGYSDRYATSFWTQISVLSNRSFSDMYRYPSLLRMHLAFALLSGVLIGTFFFNLTNDYAGTQNRIGMLLFMLIVLAFGSMSSIGFMARERAVFAQERAGGCYRPTAYFIVKILFDLLPLRILPTMLMACLVYIMTGLQKEWVLFGTFLGVILMFSMITTLICITFATGIANVSVANLVSIVVLLFAMLFQGLMINFDALPMYLEWITFLSPFRFALNSLLVNELDGLTIYFDPFEDVEPEIISGRLVLSMFGFNVDWAYSVDLVVLAAMVVVWFVVGLVSLILFVRERR